MIRKHLNTICIIVLVIICGSLVFNGCKKDGKIKDLQVELSEATYIKDSLGKVIAVKDVEIVSNQESMKNLRAELFQTTEKYNKQVLEVKALIAQKTKVLVKDKLVPFKDTVGNKKWQDSVLANCRDVIQYYEDSTVLIGTTAKDSTAYYNVSMTLEKKGIRIDSLQLIDSQYISLTEFKGGLFKRDTKGKLKIFLPRRTKVEIKHTNPYFQNIGVDAFFFEEKKKTYVEGLFTGALGGAAIAILLMIN